MARPLRIEYPGAVYHVMNRGDRREAVFKDDVDRETYLQTLGEACAKTGWQIHAWCLMGNHFHLVIETPRGNLVAGMKWLMGTYTQRFNRRHKICGHLFQGRYKAQIIDAENSGYLLAACDYVHLNPVRAGLLVDERPLTQWRWSSYGEYLLPARKRSAWLRTDRLLGEHGITRDDVRGRHRFAEIMEARRMDEGGDSQNVQSLRRGWRLGAEDFLARLVEKLELLVKGARSARTREETEEVLAVRILREEMAVGGMKREALRKMRKGDAAKVRIARRLRAETSLTLEQIAGLLHMGAPSHVSHLLFKKTG